MDPTMRALLRSHSWRGEHARSSGTPSGAKKCWHVGLRVSRHRAAAPGASSYWPPPSRPCVETRRKSRQSRRSGPSVHSPTASPLRQRAPTRGLAASLGRRGILGPGRCISLPSRVLGPPIRYRRTGTSRREGMSDWACKVTGCTATSCQTTDGTTWPTIRRSAYAPMPHRPPRHHFDGAEFPHANRRRTAAAALCRRRHPGPRSTPARSRFEDRGRAESLQRSCPGPDAAAEDRCRGRAGRRDRRDAPRRGDRERRKEPPRWDPAW